MFPPPGFGCNYGYQYYLQRILQCSVIVRKYCVLCIKIFVGIRASPSIIIPSPPIIQPPYMKLCFQLHQFWYQLWMLCQRMTPPAYVPGMHYQWIQLQYMWRMCIQLCRSLRPPSCSSGSSWTTIPPGCRWRIYHWKAPSQTISTNLSQSQPVSLQSTFSTRWRSMSPFWTASTPAVERSHLMSTTWSTGSRTPEQQ